MYTKSRCKANRFITGFAIFAVVLAAGCSGARKAANDSAREIAHDMDKESHLKAGDQAPDFSLTDQHGETISLKNLTAKAFVLIAFYPKDNSPVCTVEFKEFRDMYHQYHALGVTIVGISTNTLKSHREFSAKYDFPFSLLSDADARVSKAYDVFHEKKGVSRRSYFLIGRDGKIHYMFVEAHQKDKRDKEKLFAAVKAAVAGK